MSTASHMAAQFLVEHAAGPAAAGQALAELDVRAAVLAQPGRVPIARMYRAWSALVRETGDPAIAVRAAQHWTLDALGLFGFCVAAAPTLGASLETAAAYIGLVTDSGTWRIERASGEVRLIWSRCVPPGDGAAVSNEMMVAAFVRCVRSMFPRLAVRVAWRHPRWQPRPPHADVLGCDVEFGAAEDAIALPARELAAVPGSANLALWRYLRALADREVANLDEPSLADRTRTAIAAALDRDGGSRPDAAAVARRLGTSERSLRRHLAAEGTSLRALLDDACLARGAALLETRQSITEVALDSGFSDGSAFARAWRRRHGAAPSRTRRA